MCHSSCLLKCKSTNYYLTSKSPAAHEVIKTGCILSFGRYWWRRTLFAKFILSAVVQPFGFFLFSSCEEGQPLKINECSDDKYNSGRERREKFKGRLGNNTGTSLNQTTALKNACDRVWSPSNWKLILIFNDNASEIYRADLSEAFAVQKQYLLHPQFVVENVLCLWRVVQWCLLLAHPYLLSQYHQNVSEVLE